MESGIPRADPAHPVLAQEHRGVQVVHLVPADVGQLRHGLLEDRRVTARALSIQRRQGSQYSESSSAA